MNSKECTIICRCEDITLEEIEQLINKGYHRIDEIKKISRCGMGICQGRACQTLVSQRLSKLLDIEDEDLGMPKSRPPFKPCRMGVLANNNDY